MDNINKDTNVLLKHDELEPITFKHRPRKSKCCKYCTCLLAIILFIIVICIVVIYVMSNNKFKDELKKIKDDKVDTVDYINIDMEYDKTVYLYTDDNDHSSGDYSGDYKDSI